METGNFGDNRTGGLLGKGDRATVPVVKTATIALASILAVLVGALVRYDGSLHPCDMVRQDLLRRHGTAYNVGYFDLRRPFMETSQCIDEWWGINFGSGDDT